MQPRIGLTSAATTQLQSGHNQQSGSPQSGLMHGAQPHSAAWNALQTHELQNQQIAMVSRALQQGRTASQSLPPTVMQAATQVPSATGPTRLATSIRDTLLRIKPNLRAVDVNALPRTAAHATMSEQVSVCIRYYA